MLLDPNAALPTLGIPNDPLAMANLFVVLVLLWTTVKIPGLVRQYVIQGGRGNNFLGMIVRVVLVQQIGRSIGLSRGAARAVTR